MLEIIFLNITRVELAKMNQNYSSNCLPKFEIVWVLIITNLRISIQDTEFFQFVIITAHQFQKAKRRKL